MVTAILHFQVFVADGPFKYKVAVSNNLLACGNLNENSTFQIFELVKLSTKPLPSLGNLLLFPQKHQKCLYFLLM